MQKNITKLTSEQKQELVSDFLENLGSRLAIKRNKINLSQSDLADCLGIDRSTLSKYESGSRDMQVSMLPLLSAYCKFPMYELFPKDESHEILDTFSKAVSITVDRKKRNKKYSESPYYKQISNCDYQENISEMCEVNEPQAQYNVSKEMYKDAEISDEYIPFSEEEFCTFVQKQDRAVVDSVISAGQFLEKIEDIPNNDTLKGSIADYIIDELVINRITQDSSEINCRAYAFYKLLYNRKMDSKNKE